MIHRRLLVLLAAAIGVVLTACGTTPPAPSVAPVETPTPTVTSVTPTPSPTSASASPSASEDPGANLVLRGNGLGSFGFGAKQADVAELLEDQLGDPDEKSSGILCELDDSSPWAETVVYGGLWVQYEAKDQSKKSPRYLSAWGFQLEHKFGAPLEIADNVPLNLTFKQLRAKYPKGKLQEVGFDGAQLFTLPNKIQFLGSGKPDQVRAGKFSTCE